MRTLNVAISDVEYNKFGLKNNVLSFSDFVDIISKGLMKKNLEAVVETADKYNLSSMTMEDITTEVRAVRQNAKSNTGNTFDYTEWQRDLWKGKTIEEIHTAAANLYNQKHRG